MVEEKKKRTKRVPPDIEAIRAQGVIRTQTQSREALRKKVKMFYDLQRMRLQTSGRIQHHAEGADIQLHPYDLALLEERAKSLEVAEKFALQDIEEHLQGIRLWSEIIAVDRTRFVGIGPTMAGVILSEFDINIADTVSKFWAYSGLAPIAATRCKLCNTLVAPVDEKASEPEYTHVQPPAYRKGEKIVCQYAKIPMPFNMVYPSGKAARPVRGEKLHYNSWVRTRMLGVLGPILMKVNSPYRKYYDDYKHRWQTANKGRNDGHRHAAAIRYMIKMLLADIWEIWRDLEGLPKRPRYAEEKLGMPPHHGGVLENNQRPVPQTEGDAMVAAEMEMAKQMDDKPGD